MCGHHARAEPGELAELYYRGTLGVCALVYGLCEWQRRPQRAVATRVCVLSGGRKKDDLVIEATV